MSYLDELENVSAIDVQALNEAQFSYGDSWKRRGGVGAFMMLARKWDRLERAMQFPMEPVPYDIFERT